MVSKQRYMAFWQTHTLVPELQPVKPAPRPPPPPAAATAVHASPVIGAPGHGSSAGRPPAPAFPAGAPPVPGPPLVAAPALPLSAPPAGFPGVPEPATPKPEPASELVAPALLEDVPPALMTPAAELSSPLLFELPPQAASVPSPTKKIEKLPVLSFIGPPRVAARKKERPSSVNAPDVRSPLGSDAHSAPVPTP
jgi:hypothetical protein